MSTTPAAINSDRSSTSSNSVVALIDEGNALEEQGRIAEAMASYDAAVRLDPRCARAHLNRGNLLLAGGQIDEARSAYQRALACDPNYAAAHFNLGNLDCRAGEYEHAVLNYRAAISIEPEFANALVAMGNALDSLGRSHEAIESYERALTINPGDAGAHFNLGLAAATAGRHQQAADSLRIATDLAPEYAAAHYHLGRALSALGHIDAAEASFRRALSLAPETTEIRHDLAMTLLASGKSPEALQLAVRNLGPTPSWRSKAAFAACVTRTRFAKDNPQLRHVLTTAINEPWAAPYVFWAPAVCLIMSDPRIASCVHRANKKWPARVPKAELFGAEGLAVLAADSLVQALLTATPMSSIEFERFLTAARHALIETATGATPADAKDTAALPFYAALAQHCFINEYIFDCGEGERAMADAARTRLLALLDANAAVPPLLLLAVAAYFPLYTLPKSSRLLAANQPAPVDEVLRQQVREPLEEQALRGSIECLTSISPGVSEEVRDQYEESPYPRWVKLPLHGPALRFNAEMRREFPLAQFEPLHDDSRPEMLIAGCGTGSHSIAAAQRFRGLRVLALDLSLSSTSYAMRKTRELGITNIDYAQVDILKLDELSRTFDIIASDGVLHHLADPFQGWRILLSRLRAGGFMHLGLYSRLARAPVFRARAFIAARGYADTPEDIRRFRREIAAGDLSSDLQWLTRSPDFFYTSGCRDLIFHVQEHCLTLDQIESFIAETNLRFIGFDIDPRMLHQYRTRFSDDPAATNLRYWAQFEAENPDTFSGMYQFWIQRPMDH